MWIHGELLAFVVSRGPNQKPIFRRKLPLVGDVCRTAWVLAAGFQNKENTRIRRVEAVIRRGTVWKPQPDINPRELDLNLSTYARDFVTDKVIKHSQYCPVDKKLSWDYIGGKNLFKEYKKELAGFRHLMCRSFLRVINTVLCNGVTDPETGVHFAVELRKARARGFASCNLCEYYKHKIAGSQNPTKKAAYQRKLQKHISDVRDDREELARVIRLCITNPKHAGFYIDAADSCKFGIPTTEAKGKNMSELWRIRQKLTCVQEFDLQKSLHFFRTLPDVPTGGNLTATILMKFLSITNVAQKQTSIST